jgi:DNA-binding transcriptional MocR family regulator
MVLAAAFREQIVRGELPNGSSLSVEEDLIKETSFSRFTVREALRLLEAEGLLETDEGSVAVRECAILRLRSRRRRLGFSFNSETFPSSTLGELATTSSWRRSTTWPSPAVLTMRRYCAMS